MGAIYKNRNYYGGGGTVDEALSTTSINPVQNKVITEALDNKVPKEDGKGLSDNNFTNDLKTKLDNIEAQANKTEILNVLDSDKTTSGLSAKQGKILNEKVELEKIHNVELSILGWTVPSECLIQNEINGNTFTQKVGRVDLGNFGWNYKTDNNVFQTVLSILKNRGIVYCGKYEYTSQIASSMSNNSVSTAPSYITHSIMIKDTSYTNADTFKQSLVGTYLYYELETPITYSISDNNNIIEIEATHTTELSILGYTVPSECPIQNSVDGNVFTQRVGRVDLGSLEWVRHSSVVNLFEANFFGFKKTTNSKDFPNVYSSVYKAETWADVDTQGSDKVALSYFNDLIRLYDTNYTDADKFTKRLIGVYLYYELATPITYSISDRNDMVQRANRDTTVNLLNPTLGTTTSNGVTYTNNGDGTYTASGKASGGNSAVKISILLELGTYKFVGCPNGGSNSTYRITVVFEKANGSYVTVEDFGNGTIFTIDKSQNVSIYMFVYENNNAPSSPFKPMLTTNLNATYEDFVPYTGDSGRLCEDVAEINKYICNDWGYEYLEPSAQNIIELNDYNSFGKHKKYRIGFAISQSQYIKQGGSAISSSAGIIFFLPNYGGITQIFKYHNTPTAKYRSYYNGTWTGWKQISTTDTTL